MDLNDNLILRHFKLTHKINHDRIESTRKVGINILSKRAHLSSSSECNMKEVVFAESLMWLGETSDPSIRGATVLLLLKEESPQACRTL